MESDAIVGKVMRLLEDETPDADLVVVDTSDRVASCRVWLVRLQKKKRYTDEG